jgi:hypothetical protein
LLTARASSRSRAAESELPRAAESELREELLCAGILPPISWTELRARLWQTRVGDVPSNAPISYTVSGRQYVAMVVGNGGAQAATFPALVPEIRNPPDRGASVWVFALPERRVR